MAAAGAATNKRKATALHSLIVRARGACESCGNDGPRIQCAHIISRRYANTRTALDNAFCLCATCHMYYTEWPLAFAEFVVRTVGQAKYDELRQRALLAGKVDWAAEVVRLNEIWAGTRARVL